MKINLAVQIIPKSTTVDMYMLIDLAIDVIATSGLKYLVCPFETVVEGEYEEVMLTVKQAQDVCLASGADEVIVNLKIHRSAIKDLSFEDKIEKFR
ncbi:MAG: thiamine-binding protein [Bacteroidetes bacterium]|nr:thiamine-binding protein [Bacteroidales bacterium]NJO69764.1 thiamine-binding protein [Bacteroidota bacterium]